MSRIPSRRWLLPAVIGLLAVLAVVMAACGDDDDSSKTGTSGSSDAAVLQSIQSLDGAGLHAIDQSINNDKAVPATAHTVILQAQTTVLLTTWPADLNAKARALATIFGNFAAAIDTDTPDLAKAGDLAHQAHEGEHDLSHATWDYLYGKAGVKAPPDEADDD